MPYSAVGESAHCEGSQPAGDGAKGVSDAVECACKIGRDVDVVDCEARVEGPLQSDGHEEEGDGGLTVTLHQG